MMDFKSLLENIKGTLTIISIICTGAFFIINHIVDNKTYQVKEEIVQHIDTRIDGLQTDIKANISTAELETERLRLMLYTKDTVEVMEHRLAERLKEIDQRVAVIEKRSSESFTQ